MGGVWPVFCIMGRAPEGLAEPCMRTSTTLQSSWAASEGMCHSGRLPEPQRQTAGWEDCHQGLGVCDSCSGAQLAAAPARDPQCGFCGEQPTRTGPELPGGAGVAATRWCGCGLWTGGCSDDGSVRLCGCEDLGVASGDTDGGVEKRGGSVVWLGGLMAWHSPVK
jgi:hypothetical protein